MVFSKVNNSNFEVVHFVTSPNDSYLHTLQIEHSWFSSTMDALDISTLIEKNVITEESFLFILEDLLMEGDYSYQQGLLLLRHDSQVLSLFLQEYSPYFIQFLELMDS